MLTTAPGATYGFKSGSSMATAYVSGLAALMIERNPGISREQLVSQIHASTKDPMSTSPLVDLCRAISQSGDELVCTQEAMVVTDTHL